MNKITEYEKVCDLVKKIDSKIRFAGIINEKGNLVAGGMKKNITPLESEKDDEMLFMELALRVRMRREFDRQLGKVTFALAVREKALAMSFPLNDETLYVYAEKDVDYTELPKRILDIIQKKI